MMTQTETNQLMMGNRKDHTRVGKHKAEGDKLWHYRDRRDLRRTTSKGEGGVGALEASRDLGPGQVASRAVPVPGPTVELGVRAAMVDQRT